jgi:hypothetical protein
LLLLQVRVRFARRTEGIPGVPGRPEPPLDFETVKEVKLRREKVALSPLYYTALQVGTMCEHVFVGPD